MSLSIETDSLVLPAELRVGIMTALVGARVRPGAAPATRGAMRRHAILRLEHPKLSARVDVRGLVVVGALSLAILATWSSVCPCDYPIGPTDVVEAIAGRGREGAEFVVLTLRLPRGPRDGPRVCPRWLSGAVFQVSRRTPSSGVAHFST